MCPPVGHLGSLLLLGPGGIPDSTDFLYKLLGKQTFPLSRPTYFRTATSYLWIYTGSHGLKVYKQQYSFIYVLKASTYKNDLTTGMFTK